MAEKKYTEKKTEKNREKRGLAGKCLAILFWLAVWALLSRTVNNRILMATPSETVRRLTELLGQESFYRTLAGSLLRIGTGFGLGFGLAAVLAAAAFRFRFLEELANPFMSLVKTVPVASFAVLLLVWQGPSRLTAAICFLVVLPNIYMNVTEGLKSMDVRLPEMAEVFRLPFWNRFFYIYRPALKPFLYGGLKVSLGMCWKAGVAAEVIGIPDASIGEQLYLSKIYLDTAGVFAWTAVIILLSVLAEKGVLGLAALFFAWEPPCRTRRSRVRPSRGRGGSGEGSCGFRLTDIEKVYDGRKVLDRVSAVYEQGKTYYLTGPSGSGKTTMLRILAGLTEPDGGSITGPAECSMVFQEDRLCEEYSALKNVELVTGDPRRARKALEELLEKEAPDRLCSRLSGGMKRRVALARAMEADSDCVLLDEPFTGMDRETRLRAEVYIRSRQRGRTVIMATHTKENNSETNS